MHDDVYPSLTVKAPEATHARILSREERVMRATALNAEVVNLGGMHLAHWAAAFLIASGENRGGVADLAEVRRALEGQGLSGDEANLILGTLADAFIIDMWTAR